MRMIRSIAIIVALLLSSALLANSAAALTVSPAGSYTTTAGTTRLMWTSHGQSLSCTASSLTFRLAADGTGTVPAGSASYYSCKNALLGTYTITQTKGWWIATTLSGGSISLVMTVPTDGLTIAFTGCTVSLGGTFTFSAAAATLPATRSSFGQAGALTTTSNSRGSLCSLSPVGLTLTTMASNAVSPSLTVS